MMNSPWPTGSYRIFISYAREDATNLALKLRNDLADAGHDIWLDLAEIAAGSSWARDIEEAIEYCDIVLILMSNGSYVSDICRAEQLRSIRKGKRIIPVLVQSEADRPLHLEHINYIDFSRQERYMRLFSDLLDYISTGYTRSALEDQESVEADDEGNSRPLPPVQGNAAIMERKRDARAFRRYLMDLREEPWLGEHHWWTYFLFYYADVQDIAHVLTTGEITAPKKRQRFDRTVRLNFRPRTPDLFGCEGVRPASARPMTHCAVPVYLLFDLENLITLPDSRFSAGDLSVNKKTFKTAMSFRDLPFDLIYHDQYFAKEERDEILSARRAQVILPDKLDLTYLRHILCRSAAEQETLLNLLPEAARKRWQGLIATRPDYNLFNGKWTFVNNATLTTQGAHMYFNPCVADADTCTDFEMRVEVQATEEMQHTVNLGKVKPEDALEIDLSDLNLNTAYTLRLYLDDALAYMGRYQHP